MAISKTLGAWGSKYRPSKGTALNPLNPREDTLSGWGTQVRNPTNTPTPQPATDFGTYLDPNSALRKQQLGTRRDNAYADITQDAGRHMTEYGYTGQDTNNDGIPDSGFQVDPNNPFSRAALLQRSYDQAQRGTTNSMAAQGQLYSGALQNALNEDRFQFDRGTDQNMKAFDRGLTEFMRGRRDAGQNFEEGVSNIDWEALVQALAARSVR